MNNLNPNTPNLTDVQISRESIYEEQILRQILNGWNRSFSYGIVQPEYLGLNGEILQ